MMENDELVARQARRIAELEDESALYHAASTAIRRYIVGVGGPLNDNKLGYTNEQLSTFHAILATLASGNRRE